MLIPVGSVIVALVSVNGGLVRVVTDTEFHVVAGVHDMAPTGRCIEVGVMEGCIGCKGELVTGPVAKDLEGILGVGLMGNGGVYVLEGGFAAMVVAVFREQAQDPVGIGGTSAQGKGGLVFYYRAFQMQAAGQKTQAQGAGKLLGIAFPRADIQHRGDAASVFGRDGAFVQFGLRNQVRVKGGEDAEHVVGVEDRSVVI